MEKLTGYYLSLSPVRKGVLVSFIALALMLPWLGMAEFNTKGEPREAVVSLSMLQQGNWILPVNNDIDIPYKPMMFHWLGAIASAVNGGEVNEFTSRLPSLLALALISGATCWFYTRYMRKKWEPILASAILLTCFEMHRSGTVARVDMVLTFWMVMAFFLLYRWWNRDSAFPGRRMLYRVPWLAILCMSGAVLTKGPVGAMLPCLAMGLFMLVKGDGFWRAVVWMISIAILSLLLPMWWYYSAWKQGGEAFLTLVMEENFGRLTGTMTYESHANPWHYNFWITAAGFMPWTLLALFGAVQMFLRSLKKGEARGNHQVRRRIGFRWKGSDAGLYSLIVLGVVMLFYCLPASKRSVYLMPAYPFIAWWAARWFVWLGAKGYSSCIRCYGDFLATLGCMLEVLFLGIKILPTETIVFSGKNAEANRAMFEALKESGSWPWVSVTVLLICSSVWFAWMQKRNHPVKMLGTECILVGMLFVALDSGLQPAALNTKSISREASEIAEFSREEDLPVYEFIEFGETAGANKYHFFELDFYLDDQVKNFRKRLPDHGLLLIPRSDVTKWLPIFESEGYSFYQLRSVDRPSRREKIEVYQFCR